MLTDNPMGTMASSAFTVSGFFSRRWVRAGRNGRTVAVSNTSGWLRLVVSLPVFPPACALLGAFSTLDSKMPLGWGLSIGLPVGILFGLAFGGVKGRWLDALLGPEELGEDGKRRIPLSPDASARPREGLWLRPLTV
jgi:hypothetical protein